MQDDTNTSSSELQVSVAPAAKHYRDALGWKPIPLRPESKQPIGKDWLRAETNDATAWPGNVGVLLGAPSGGLVDIDLDSDAARRLARLVLPQTPARFGRGGAVTHWFYDCGDAAPTTATIQFARGFGDNKDKPLLELRSTGGQTMVPPSIHPSGERLQWEPNFEAPRIIEATNLASAVSVLAAVSLMYENFPGEGARFHAYAAMTGVLLRSGVPEDKVEGIVELFTDHFGSEKPRARKQSVRQLAQRLETGDDKVAGFKRLEEVFGKDVARRCREWLRADGSDWECNKHGAIIAGSLHNNEAGTHPARRAVTLQRFRRPTAGGDRRRR